MTVTAIRNVLVGDEVKEEGIKSIEIINGSVTTMGTLFLYEKPNETNSSISNNKGTNTPLHTSNTTNINTHLYPSTLSTTNTPLSDRRWFVYSMTERVVISVGDLVIGSVIYVCSEYYKIELGNGCIGILPLLNFINANKRNKPDLKKGDVIYSRVIKGGVEVLLSCKEEGLGVVGCYFYVGRKKCVRLLFDKHYFKECLGNIGRGYKYRIGIGVNGRIWVESDSVKDIRDILYIERIKGVKDIRDIVLMIKGF
ncbi:hypothetical protein CWI38_1958p0010 [Hamiltosporidium tvaerminnensis]|uniref:S1 motif domain-containing protein n=1 Tax=Hamiltosporidium tvaerminnensis TaxID=1176355 RepID=A0A4Q9LPB6_9MICR|nr:hypothetical protein CWI38_1958p0010 [Hamiltosporidium tvaerminnensis]